MTKEGFEDLQQEFLQSGLSLKLYLQQIGTGYSTWSYWRKKYSAGPSPEVMAPVTFTKPPVREPADSGGMPAGATLLFPNGVRAHFGSGAEGVLMEILTKSLSCDVLP